MRDLAEHMGIGGASLYNAYGGKRTLFVAALERYANRSSRERIARLGVRQAYGLALSWASQSRATAAVQDWSTEPSGSAV